MTTVLVVDDRATNREIARDTLDGGGYQVIEAASGRQALRMAKERRPDIVLTDVLMPGMDCYQFAQEMRNDPETAGIPLLFFTANYRPEEVSALAAAIGINRILDKSTMHHELLGAVAEALREGAARSVTPSAEFDSRHIATLNAKLLEKVGALDRSEARFAAMADASPVGIVIADELGRSTYVNPRLSEITGRPAAGLLGRGWLSCLDTDTQAAPETETLLPGAGERRNLRLSLADGRQRWLSLLTKPIVESDRGVAGSVTVVDDITLMVETDERRRLAEVEVESEARRQAIARFDSLTRLAGGVAHDFNNLLNIILSYDDFVREAVTESRDARLGPEEADAILGDLDKIHQAGLRAAELTHQLLTFGGREPTRPVTVDLNGLLTGICRELIDAQCPDLTVTTHLDPGLHSVLADPEQLRQAFLNLTANACEAMPDGGRLHVETTNTVGPVHGLPAGGYIGVTLTDSGAGMTAEVAHQAMEPFFTTKPKGAGKGLGLATSYGVIRQAGGTIVISSAPGRGTTLHILLPTADAVDLPREPVSTGPAVAGRTILVAEDEDDLREVITRVLERAGLTVLAAANGAEALALAERHGDLVDVLLSDVVMPVMNGRDLAKAFRLRYPAVPVLFMSGFAEPLMNEQGFIEDDATVVNKPFTAGELLAAVRATLRSPAVPVARG